MNPSYPLKQIKELLKINHFRFSDPALQDAHNDFNWGPEEMKKALLRLNARDYVSDPERNHFYKTEEHRKIPHTKMDYYKVKNGPDGNSLYTHFYVHPTSGALVISSFKEL